MKKEYILVIFLAVVIVVLLGVLAFFPAKKVVIAPTTGIIVTSPKPNEEVNFPVEISGYVDGKDGWVGFEGQVGTVRLISKEGVEVSSAPLTATTDWMKFPTKFRIIFDFAENVGYIPEGTLVFKNENPSGEPSRERTFSLPITIKPSRETMQVLVFFNGAGPGNECENVIGSTRIIPKTTAVARAALEQLLLGTTNQDGDTLSTSINPGVKIQSLVIDNAGTAKVDFNEQLQFQVGGSCRVAAIRAQITKTLLQFPTIKNVIISIEGKTEDILQP